MFDAIEFCQDHDIEYWTEGENVQIGWINIQCPFCDDHSNHGGINPYRAYYNCWRCDWHPLDRLIQELLNVSFSEVKAILKDYTSNKVKEGLKKKRQKSNLSHVSLPAGTSDIQEKHRKYLRKRNFDPDEIVRKWDVKGTSHLGDFKWRIIIPIYYKGQIVSYTSRDITDKQEPRYKTAVPEQEVIFHKDILYGLSHSYQKGIIVEGPMDVWRMRENTVSTFGTQFSLKQIKLIADSFSEVFILFDPDAYDKAEKLGRELAIVGCKSTVISHDLGCDPGDLSQEDADYLRKNLIGF